MAGPRPGKLPLILGALTALGPLSIDMYLPSFQAIARDLAASPARVQLTLAVYFIALGIGQAFYGPVSDRFGRRRPLCVGLTVYVLASAGCALARSIEVLVAFRFVQALGGCAGMVIARAVVRDRFDEREAARFFSLLMLVTGLAPILAPSLGGQVVAFLSWRAIFWILSGFGLYGLTTVLLLLPESLPRERRAHGGVGEALHVYASLLGDRPFMRYALSGALVMSGMFAYIFGSPFVFMQIHGVRPERFGWIFGAIAFGLISASQLNRFLLARIAAPRILSRALIVTAAAGSALAVVAWSGMGGLPALIAPLFVYVASLGFVLPNVIATALGPQGRRAGTASALLGTLQFGAGAIVGMLLGALGNGTALPMAGLIAVCGLAALTGCNTVAGMKQDTNTAVDYTYDKKEEYQQALAAQLRDLDAKTDELKEKAAKSSDSAKAEFNRSMESLDRQKAVLNEKMAAVKTSTASSWNDVKAGADSAMDSVKRAYEKAKASLP